MGEVASDEWRENEKKAARSGQEELGLDSGAV
jgi:hypothetical protein